MRHIKENPHDGIERELNIHDNIDIVIYVNGIKLDNTKNREETYNLTRLPKKGLIHDGR